MSEGEASLIPNDQNLAVETEGKGGDAEYEARLRIANRLFDEFKRDLANVKGKHLSLDPAQVPNPFGIAESAARNLFVEAVMPTITLTPNAFGRVQIENSSTVGLQLSLASASMRKAFRDFEDRILKRLDGMESETRGVIAEVAGKMTRALEYQANTLAKELSDAYAVRSKLAEEAERDRMMVVQIDGGVPSRTFGFDNIDDARKWVEGMAGVSIDSEQAEEQSIEDFRREKARVAEELELERRRAMSKAEQAEQTRRDTVNRNLDYLQHLAYTICRQDCSTDLMNGTGELDGVFALIRQLIEVERSR